MTRSPGLAVLLLATAFAAFSAALLANLAHIIDEGVNILYGGAIARGETPYVDFFYHQPPLHLYVLAAMSHLDPYSVFLHRLPSLVATAASGGFLYAIARRIGPPRAAVASVALFYWNPLQTFDLLALPEAPMLLFSLAGVYGVVFREERRWVVLGAASLVVSVLFKPLSLATIAAVGTTLALRPEQRWKLLPFTTVIAAGGIASWVVLHVATDGVFSELLGVTFDRYTRKTWFRRLQALTGLQAMVPAFFTRSPMRFALFSHLLAAVYLSLALLPAGIAGARVFLRRDALAPAARVLIRGWLLFPLAFSFFVWEPAWTHYHVQYLPALSILAGLFLERLAGRSRRGRIAAALWLVLACAGGALFETTMTRDYDALRSLELPGRRLLAFDPFLNVLTRTEPACGLDDPMNQTPPTVFEGHPTFQRFRVTSRDVIACMEANPDVPILIDGRQPHAFMVVDRELYDFVRRQDERRLVVPRAQDRAALRALFEDEDAGGRSSAPAGTRGP